MAAVTDPMFTGLVENCAQLAVFRVRQLGLARVAAADWGSFYSGDCYLVHDGRHGGSHIHYWIGGGYISETDKYSFTTDWPGSQSSQDEQAVAAIKAVELDNLFGGLPVQHREVEGHESTRFKQMFPGGVVTMRGGWDSGLRGAGRQHEARLFQVLGGRAPVMREVALAWPSLNHGDTFVLDSGSVIFVWSGAESSGGERLAAAHLASKLRDKVGENIVNVADGEEGDLAEEELSIWCRHLPLEHRDQVQEAGGQDRAVVRIVREEIKLYRCSDITGEMSTELVKTGNIERNDLGEDDAFILDAGEALGVWIWLGRKSNPQERQAAVQAGLTFIELRQLPAKTRVTRVNMGGEPEEFKSLFTKW